MIIVREHIEFQEGGNPYHKMDVGTSRIPKPGDRYMIIKKLQKDNAPHSRDFGTAFNDILLYDSFIIKDITKEENNNKTIWVRFIGLEPRFDSYIMLDWFKKNRDSYFKRIR